MSDELQNWGQIKYHEFFGECEYKKKKQNPVFKLFKLSVDIIQVVSEWVYTTKNWIGRPKIKEQTHRIPAQRRLIRLCKGDENENNTRICLNSRTQNHLKNLEFLERTVFSSLFTVFRYLFRTHVLAFHIYFSSASFFILCELLSRWWMNTWALSICYWIKDFRTHRQNHTQWVTENTKGNHFIWIHILWFVIRCINVCIVSL